MFQDLSAHSIRHVAILLGAIVIQFATFVHSLPAAPINEFAVSKWLVLEPRQTTPIPPALAKFPSGPLNQFLRSFVSLPEGAAALDAVGLVLTPLQQVLATSVGISTTRNDLTQNAPCTDVTVIFARGTTEPGDVGIFTGPPFFDALSKQLEGKSLAVQGVEYPATFAGFNRNGADGVPSMTAFINETFSRCPNTKVVMSGYSQGALVVRSTADSLPTATMSRISSIVTFGDPKNPATVTGGADKTLIICHPNDTVCSGGFINIDHLTYADDAEVAGHFVIQKANF